MNESAILKLAIRALERGVVLREREVFLEMCALVEKRHPQEMGFHWLTRRRERLTGRLWVDTLRALGIGLLASC